jgi:hypothetical protein
LPSLYKTLLRRSPVSLKTILHPITKPYRANGADHSCILQTHDGLSAYFKFLSI